MRKYEREMSLEAIQKENQILRSLVDNMDRVIQEAIDDGVTSIWCHHGSTFAKLLEFGGKRVVHLTDRTQKARLGHPFVPSDSDIIVDNHGVPIVRPSKPKTKRSSKKRH